jgi:hypothetical protein
MSEQEIPSKEQLEALEILQRVFLTRILFYVVIGAFVLILIVFIVALFLPWIPPNLKISIGALDGLLSLSFSPIVKHLYPNRDSKPSGSGS